MTDPVGKTSRPRLPSILPGWLRKLLAASVALAGFLLADTLYLLLVRLADEVALQPFALGATSLPRFYQFMVLAHTGVGLLLFAVMVLFLVAHLPTVWKRYHRAALFTGVPYALLGITLTVTGLFILSAAASRENRWAWWVHVGAAALVVAAYVAHRVVSYARPAGVNYARFLGAVSAGALGLFLVHGALAATGAGLAPLDSEDPGGAARDVAGLMAGRFGPSGWVPVGAVPPQSPFFPSAATTTTGAFLEARIIMQQGFGVADDVVREEVAIRGFVTESRIGAESCESCHPDVTDQWAASAHRFASFNNPFYEATIRDLRDSNRTNPWVEEHLAAFGGPSDAVGRTKSKWCSGCHDPALMLAGDMDGEIDRASTAAQAGLTCLACHAIDRIHDRTGNANYNIADAQEDPYVFANAEPGSLGRYLHDAALKARPAVHQAQLLQPFFKEAEFCATCHKVSLPEPVNSYRWLRGQNEFDNWDDSGVSLNAARTFYLPPARRVCQDCHMPREVAPRGDVAAEGGTVRSHRFVAANTALPFVRGDTATVRRVEEFLQAEKLRVDVLAAKWGGEREPMALDTMPRAVPVGVPVTFDVVVRNTGVGHTFPGGTNDSNEGWLEFTIAGEDGESLVVSGWVGSDGHLDPKAHTFKAVIVDRDGQAITKRNAQDIHVTVYANVIGPGSADLAHYEVVLPSAWEGRSLSVTARLLWRKFDRRYTEFAFATNPEGFRSFDAVPDLPITEIASDRVWVRAAAPGDSPPLEGPAQPGWIEWNDYGIALLAEGDSRAAAAAFRRVEALRPEQLDGPLNLARTALVEGDLDGAYAALDRTEAVRAGDPRAAWVWGQALQEDGLYPEAAEAYERVLASFPGDRATWRALGRTLYLDLRFDEAIAALDRVLEIDPEDRIAHYHRMLSLRALGRADEAARAEAAYVYYGVDETAQEITRAYRARDEGANTMAQPVPTHRLEIGR